jgi:hypothetical protein
MKIFKLSLCALKCLLIFVFLGNVQLAAAEVSTSAIEPEWLYSMRPGDNLIQFAKQHLINPDDWHTLQKLNNIKKPTRMQFGKILRVPLHLVKQLPAPAEVALASGQAGILKTDNSLEPVAAGQKLTAGTALKTGNNSKLNIKFADGSIVSMQPNSILKLDTLSIYSGGGMVDTTLRLQQGKLETEANPAHRQGNQMQIITPTAVAAVRGTKFRVSTSDVSITQETLEGKVALSAAGAEVAVDKGFGSLCEGGKAPLPPILLIAAPVTSSLPVNLESVPVAFNMPAQDGAVAWLGKLSSDAQFSSILAEKLSDGRQLSFNDMPDGKYYLKVRAKDKQGLEGYDATHEFNLNARPFAPIIVAPAQAATVREPNPELSWTKIEQANQYLLQLARDVDFKQLLDSQQLTNTSYKLAKNLEPGQYYWRLASIDGTDQGPFMAPSSFIYKAKPGVPDISQLKVHVHQNKVFVSTVKPPDGLAYQATVHNEFNNQKNVWQNTVTGSEFSFLLKEYGKQTLILRLVDAESVVGPDAIYEFNAAPP